MESPVLVGQTLAVLDLMLFNLAQLARHPEQGRSSATESDTGVEEDMMIRAQAEICPPGLARHDLLREAGCARPEASGPLGVSRRKPHT